MSTKLGSLDQLKLIALRSKSYTSGQIAEVASAVEEIANDLSDELSARLKWKVVDTLPEYSADVENIIFYLRKNDGEVGDQYEEYQFINGRPEKIGRKTDLSGYVTSDDVAKADDVHIKNIVEKQQSNVEKYIGTGNVLAFWNAVKAIIDEQLRRSLHSALVYMSLRPSQMLIFPAIRSL